MDSGWRTVDDVAVRDILDRLPGWFLSEGALKVRWETPGPALVRAVRGLAGVRIRRLQGAIEVAVPVGPRAAERAFALEALHCRVR